MLLIFFEDVSDEYGESEKGGSHNEEAVDDNDIMEFW